MNYSFVFSIVFTMFALFFIPAFAEEYSISIPFGAYNPELNTPAEVW